jgi:hypothetical protein
MLEDYQVPLPPYGEDGTPWTDTLRWLVCVMNPDDRSLHFIASVLSSALKNGGLTERQAAAAKKIEHRIMRDYDAGVLDCQINGESCDSGYDLANLEAKGEA